MAVEIVYPSTLPGPTAAPFQSAERRLLSSLPGPRQSRPMQRDRHAYQQLDFVFTHAECAIFEAWLEDSLVRAGAWFSSTWSQPQGGVGVRRFIGEPSYPIYYPTVGWHVSAQVEVRGRSELPTGPGPCFIEDFNRDSPLAVYTTATGNTGLFTVGSTPYVKTLSIASQNAGATAFIAREIDEIDVRSISITFNVASDNTDDSAEVLIRNGVSNLFYFIPRREYAADHSRRALIAISGGGEVFVSGAGEIEVGSNWYQLDVVIVPGLDRTHARLTNLTDNVVIRDTSVTGSYSVLPGDSLGFYVDSGGPTCATKFADIHICP